MSWAEMTDNLSSACNDTFGQEVDYTPRRGTSFPLIAIFDADHVVIEGGGEVGIETVKPVLSVQNSLFEPAGHPAPAQGDTVKFSGKEYEIVSAQPDGESDTLLILSRVR
ncbi:MAG: hypothetical protein V7727_19965 [Sneathiella sp.]